MTGYIRVKNLEKFQHYRDRRPPWIKLYRSVFSDYAFGRLQDASKAHLMLIWLLATEYDNRLPNDPKWLARKIDATHPVDVQALISAGFIELCEDASTTLATCAENARPENREQRTETTLVAKGAKPEESPDVVRVLEHFRTAHPRRRPGPKDAKLVARALGWGYSADDLCAAITGNARDEWHAQRKKHELAYVLRDNGKIDDFRERAALESDALREIKADSWLSEGLNPKAAA